jgi:hypothetical protein
MNNPTAPAESLGRAVDAKAVAIPLTDARILHLWDTRVGELTESCPLTDDDKLAFARAVLYDAAAPGAAALPAGFRLVPIEPTTDMLDEGREAMRDSHNVGNWGECGGVNWGDAEACWRAMLSSAPTSDSATQEKSDGPR